VRSRIGADLNQLPEAAEAGMKALFAKYPVAPKK
jgi:hypothetical protein